MENAPSTPAHKQISMPEDILHAPKRTSVMAKAKRVHSMIWDNENIDADAPHPKITIAFKRRLRSAFDAHQVTCFDLNNTS